MNSKPYISEKKRVTVLLLGAIVALFTLLSYSPVDQPTIDTEKEELADCSTSQEESQEQQQTSLSSFNAVTHVIQLHVPIVGDYIKVEFPTELSSFFSEEIFGGISTSKLFRTLFRRIISPNAP